MSLKVDVERSSNYYEVGRMERSSKIEEERSDAVDDGWMDGHTDHLDCPLGSSNAGFCLRLDSLPQSSRGNVGQVHHRHHHDHHPKGLARASSLLGWRGREVVASVADLI